MELDGDGLLDGLILGDSLELGDMDADGETLGEALLLGEILLDGDTLGLTLGESEDDGDTLGETDELGLTDADGLNDGEGGVGASIHEEPFAVIVPFLLPVPEGRRCSHTSASWSLSCHSPESHVMLSSKVPVAERVVPNDDSDCITPLELSRWSFNCIS